MNLKFKNFQNTLLKNSEEVDSFIKKNLPRNEGLNKKLIQAIKYSILGSGKKIRSFLVIEIGKVVSDINNLTFNKQVKENQTFLESSGDSLSAIDNKITDNYKKIDNYQIKLKDYKHRIEQYVEKKKNYQRDYQENFSKTKIFQEVNSYQVLRFQDQLIAQLQLTEKIKAEAL